MNAGELNPLACAAFLIAAFTLAGICQTAWLTAPASRRFAAPLDGGRTFAGHRVFGENKTVRGFVVMLPAAGLAFALLASVLSALPAGLNGLWLMSPGGYALLGIWSALGFMIGELPNSFLKRQLGIPPGAAATGRVAGTLFFILDRLDSIVGLMLALVLVVRVPRLTWIFVALAGPVVHWLFSVALFRLGVKARPA